MKQIPGDLDQTLMLDAAAITGWLTPREMRFLSHSVLNRTAEGRIVELGYYHGKSTAVLAATLKTMGCEELITVDPLDPTPLFDNLRNLDLTDHVDVRHQTSSEFAAGWNHPIALLWHDGANDYETVLKDCRSLFPFLADGAIVAFHDVLNTSGERIHVFDELVLHSSNFGWAGVCGSIGFGRYHCTPIESPEVLKKKQRLSARLRLLKPFHSATKPNPKGVTHTIYRLLRSRVPHGPLAGIRAA